MPLLDQIKKRRIALGFKQSDMQMRVGMSRQQYQRLEASGNPRLNTLELVAKGLNSEIMLIPQEKREAVLALLASHTAGAPCSDIADNVIDAPWKGLLGDDD
ncbi:helix-turn-helix domain-containing protein [Vreelandella olivaria]|uniref:helix-turn-helix domain-containing protein n=1 Tax=Vreelandella olivaria TaxID=390919 RepID=UPI00201F30D5|nr:helix-turn-helix transcriptional regulator [Halomonas olivaria]